MITAPPAMPKLMADAPTIFMDIFNKSLKDQDQFKDHNSIVHLWSKEFVQRLLKSREFHGTVHCEASLMGAIVHYNGQANTESSMQNTHIFHVSCWMSSSVASC
jgi:hypothetical protein